MPCYDERNEPAYVRAEAEREWMHNSPVAELLCSVMRRLEREGMKPYTAASSMCNKDPALARWWRDHLARDRARQEKVKKIAKRK